MKNIYIVKHYWDEKSYGATLEPKWLFSSDNLNKEEKKIKNIILECIKLSKYNSLALNKPFYEKKDNFYIYFCYKDKNDPDPSNNRKVTDITFIISPKSLKYPCDLMNQNNYIIKSKKNYFILIISIFVLIVLWFYLNQNSLNQELQSNKQQNITKQIEIKQNIKKTIIITKEENTQFEKICKKYNNFKKGNKCYEQYFREICNKKYKDNYDKWLNNQKMCKVIVENSTKDKELRLAPTELQKFIKNYKNK